jgi:hypothetical protein
MKLYISYIALAAIILSVSCNKNDFLDAKPDQSLVVPSTLQDLQAILDNDYVMNGFGSSGYPVLGETAADDYYVSDRIYNDYFMPLYKNACIWNKDVYSGETILDWDLPYRCVFYSNVVIDGLASIPRNGDNYDEWNNEMGSALAFRANAFYLLSQVFAPLYDSATASTDWGIPLRLHGDVNEPIARATVQDTYNKIVLDLDSAVQLLPDKPLYPTRPSKAAAYGLLARVYLSMRAYNKALLYADSCLQIQNELMDYNTISTTSVLPFQRFNSEVIFTYMLQKTEINPVSLTISNVDSTLYASYADNDLRKQIFFKNFGTGNNFLGTYDERGNVFGGLATDEMLLTRAECEARANYMDAALNDLNTLLEKRYVTGTFIPVTATNSMEALTIILNERRKELVMRGLRWTDLRRLNKEPGFARTIYRSVNGMTYSLPPNDKRYVYPIPDYVISFNPGMPQNER